ncbi:MAG: YigZ family protein, partial [Bacteroidaceae bacterium]|nr:YigZ family protein [Bacteroidaceae bacterium]
MVDDTYKTIKATSEGIYKEKGSKFLAFAIPVTTEAEIKTHVEKIKKEYYDARHHC